MKRFVSPGLLAVVVATLLFGCSSGPGPTVTLPVSIPGSTKELKAVANAQADDPILAGWNELVKRVNSGDNGFKIKVLGSNEVKGDQVTALQQGTIDIVMTGEGPAATVAPEARAFAISGLSPSEARQNGWYDVMNDTFRKKAKLSYLGAGVYQSSNYLYMSAQFKTINDVIKRKLSIPAQNSLVPPLKKLGAYVDSASGVDVRSALEKKTVDGFAATMSAWLAEGKQPLSKYVLDLPSTGWVTYPVLVNLNTWNGLSKKQQDFLKETMAAVEKDMAPVFAKAVDDTRKQADKQGSKFVVLNPEEAKLFVDLYYQSGWAELEKAAPDYSRKLKDLAKNK